ncbi:hypothetical protein [uncultured Algoriphagus sp.]|uniref:hypothetical protein n=1 Tax=uncultured Algoriphagus sp. TaxID=417365 RepID=UPI00258A264A|nr:hypothetical protein [uncultured Algoriphagus sp.]
MNSIITVDKLILCYLVWDSSIKLNRDYFKINFKYKNIYYDLGNGFRAYENTSQKEGDLKSSYQLSLEFNKRKIGTLFLENPNTGEFFFKYQKNIFYEEGYSILEIKSLIDNLFTFQYTFKHITRLEIALDTVGKIGRELTVITDLCSSNLYFKSIKNNEKEFEAIFEKYGGRSFKEAKFGSIGNLKIYHHTKFPNSTCIGDYSYQIFVKCYNKSEKSEDYQKEYFDKFFKSGSEIFRLEVSANSIAAEKYSLKIDQLDQSDYLRYKYKEMIGNRLIFNDLGKPYIDKNKNKKYQKINLLENVEFPDGKRLKDDVFEIKPVVNEDSNYKKIRSKESIVNNNRSSIGKLIGKYLRDENVEKTLVLIKDSIETEILTYNDDHPDFLGNISTIKNLLIKQLQKKDIDQGIEKAEQFLQELDNFKREFNNPIKKSKRGHKLLNVVHFYKIDKFTGKKFGIEVIMKQKI